MEGRHALVVMAGKTVICVVPYQEANSAHHAKGFFDATLANLGPKSEVKSIVAPIMDGTTDAAAIARAVFEQVNETKPDRAVTTCLG